MRLWNAHRRVFFLKDLPIQRINRLKDKKGGWQKILNDDVVKFIKDLKSDDIIPDKFKRWRMIRSILKNPAFFFSRPHNVPLQLRKQIYLPDFVITLIRTPNLPPNYASFWVPLWFNKLDFKNYLKNVYDVDVLHVRSYVQQHKVEREERTDNGKTVLGAFYRPPSTKKMTVELVDPFVYPEEEKDLSPWEAEEYKREVKEQREMGKASSDEPQIKANDKERSSLAQQAQEYLKGNRDGSLPGNLYQQMHESGRIRRGRLGYGGLFENDLHLI